jgi:hypothetical protein
MTDKVTVLWSSLDIPVLWVLHGDLGLTVDDVLLNRLGLSILLLLEGTRLHIFGLLVSTHQNCVCVRGGENKWRIVGVGNHVYLSPVISLWVLCSRSIQILWFDWSLRYCVLVGLTLLCKLSSVAIQKVLNLLGIVRALIWWHILQRTYYALPLRSVSWIRECLARIIQITRSLVLSSCNPRVVILRGRSEWNITFDKQLIICYCMLAPLHITHSKLIIILSIISFSILICLHVKGFLLLRLLLNTRLIFGMMSTFQACPCLATAKYFGLVVPQIGDSLWCCARRSRAVHGRLFVGLEV